MQFHIVTLGVADLQQSTDFYTRWFKTEPASSSNDHITFFNLKGCNLALFPRDALAEDATVPTNQNGFDNITVAITADSHQEVDELFAHAVTCGAKALKTPQPVFWGGYSGYISDNDGHLWEIAWNPFFPKDETGELMIP